MPGQEDEPSLRARTLEQMRRMAQLACPPQGQLADAHGGFSLLTTARSEGTAEYIPSSVWTQTPRMRARGPPWAKRLILVPSRAPDFANVDLLNSGLSEHIFTILESLSDALLIVDRDGRVVVVNDQAEQLFGYSRHELTGQPIEMLIPESVGEAHRAHREGYFARARSCEWAGEPLLGTDAGVWDLARSEIFFSPRWKSMLGFGDTELADAYQEWERRIHPDDHEQVSTGSRRPNRRGAFHSTASACVAAARICPSLVRSGSLVTPDA